MSLRVVIVSHLRLVGKQEAFPLRFVFVDWGWTIALLDKPYRGVLAMGHLTSNIVLYPDPNISYFPHVYGEGKQKATRCLEIFLP